MTEKRGPTSQAAHARAEEQSYTAVLGAFVAQFVPLCPGQSTFCKDLLNVEQN